MYLSLPANVAVMVVVPQELSVTLPFPSTLATYGFELVYAIGKLFGFTSCTYCLASVGFPLKSSVADVVAKAIPLARRCFL